MKLSGFKNQSGGVAMSTENIEVSVKLPRVLWEKLLQRADIGQESETILLTKAIEQFLKDEANKLQLAERLAQECEALAEMELGWITE
jgi:hypothetical protein